MFNEFAIALGFVLVATAALALFVTRKEARARARGMKRILGGMQQ